MIRAYDYLDKDESHQGGYEDEISLLEQQWRLPVNGDHADHAEVPDDDAKGDIIHG